VIDRKNFLFSDTQKSTDASAVAMSIIENAKRNGLDVYSYLLHLLNTLPVIGENPSDEQLETLIPWSSSLHDYRKAAYSEVL